MLKKLSIIFIAFLLLLIVTPITISNESTENGNGFGFRSLFAADALINVVYPAQGDYVTPNSGVLDIPLATYFTLSGRFADLQRNLLSGKTMEIELSIVNTPEWCDASLSNPLAQLSFDNTEPYESSLTVTVTEEAPAFTQGVVTIKAKSQDISGFFFKRVNAAEAEFDVSFIIGYWPVLSLELKDSFWKIPPVKQKEIPITLKNIGNGPTKVNIYIEEIPKKWDITYPKSVSLGSAVFGGDSVTKEILIKVRPPKYFKNETINVTITHHYIGRPDLEGQPTNILFTFENDGSIEEEMDFTLIIIIGVLILIIFAYIIRNSRKKKSK
jgi:hypothetical protein